MIKNGAFVVFEASSKCGKTTLAKELRETLSNRGVIVTDGRGAPTGSRFSRFLKSPSMNDVGYSTAFFWSDLIFYTADTIAPGLEKKGSVVIQDRYDLSIVAYREANGYRDDHILLREYLKRGMLIVPDLTILLKADPETVRQRVEADPTSTKIDRHLADNPHLSEQIHVSTLSYLKRLKRRYMCLDTSQMGIATCLAKIQQKILSIDGGYLR